MHALLLYTLSFFSLNICFVLPYACFIHYICYVYYAHEVSSRTLTLSRVELDHFHCYTFCSDLHDSQSFTGKVNFD